MIRGTMISTGCSTFSFAFQKSASVLKTQSRFSNALFLMKTRASSLPVRQTSTKSGAKLTISWFPWVLSWINLLKKTRSRLLKNLKSLRRRRSLRSCKTSISFSRRASLTQRQSHSRSPSCISGRLSVSSATSEVPNTSRKRWHKYRQWLSSLRVISTRMENL